jgi:hypothetical protein
MDFSGQVRAAGAVHAMGAQRCAAERSNQSFACRALMGVWIALVAIRGSIATADPPPASPSLPVGFSAQDLMPPGTHEESEVPATLDLADAASKAVVGMSEFLDPRDDYSEFCHGYFSTNPPILVHPNGQNQNWGKIIDGLVLTRQMCGTKAHLDTELKTLQGMLRYTPAKMRENYPVPLCRITLALISLQEQHPDPELTASIQQCVNELVNKISVDESTETAYFGPAENRWTKDNTIVDLGELGHWLQVFTAGTVLRTLVTADAVEGIDVDPKLLTMLRNNIMDQRYWQSVAHPPMVIPSEHGQFTGHIHSYTQALLGLLYYAHKTNDVQTQNFVRDSYENIRTLGMPRIGLFGEGCAVGDMTYLAVRLSQWGVGDYWDDADQYVRNHLTELQIDDASVMQNLVDEHAMPLKDVKPEDWVQKVDTSRVVERSQGIFFSDASHPTLIPFREKHLPYRTCVQWVVCCTGNCSKALHVAWDAITEFDADTKTARVNLLLNRAAPWVDVDSYLPFEGRVTVKNKQAERLLIRLPRWANKSDVTCKINESAAEVSWSGSYALLNELKPGDSVSLEFPVKESTEEYQLAWSEQDFWIESNQPSSPPEKPVDPGKYTLKFRGNTLVDISPRDAQAGVPLYADRSPEVFQKPVATTTKNRFVYERPSATRTP